MALATSPSRWLRFVIRAPERIAGLRAVRQNRPDLEGRGLTGERRVRADRVLLHETKKGRAGPAPGPDLISICCTTEAVLAFDRPNDRARRRVPCNATGRAGWLVGRFDSGCAPLALRNSPRRVGTAHHVNACAVNAYVGGRCPPYRDFPKGREWALRRLILSTGKRGARPRGPVRGRAQLRGSAVRGGRSAGCPAGQRRRCGRPPCGSTRRS